MDFEITNFLMFCVVDISHSKDLIRLDRITESSSTIIWCHTTPEVSYRPISDASISVTLRQILRPTDPSWLQPYPIAITILSVMLSQWLRLINWRWPQLGHIADLLMSVVLVIACALRMVDLMKYQLSRCSANFFATSTYDPICGSQAIAILTILAERYFATVKLSCNFAMAW